MATEEYKVQLEVFEGPLDLLLYLIKKEELDIHDIPIERITTQYVQYLDLMRMLDLNVAGDFLVMAATLMMIKSRMLLPPEERPEVEEEEEDDPRWDLVRQLVEYKKFKDAAIFLEALEEERDGIFGREGEHVALEAKPELALHDVSLFDLLSVFNEALKRVSQEDLKEIFAERFTVADKIEAITQRLQREDRIVFASLFDHMASRHEIVCTFLAVLELIRQRQIRAIQEQVFGDILVTRGDVE
ncbi:MAG: chromosome segregation protein ScpA [Verrucomicrobia bacterium]|nr:MAG: chromosome segregation protein ScpA [Verrucomicrobiota bacterium]